MGDILEDYIKGAVVEEANKAVEASVDEQAMGILDLALSTGFLEGAVILAGGPAALVVGIRVFKKWRHGKTTS